MPWVTPLTTPHDSSIAALTSAQLRNKAPIGYKGTLQIHPQNCSFLFDDHYPHLIHLSLDRPHSPSQTASGSNEPFCPIASATDRWSKRMFIIYCNLNSYANPNLNLDMSDCYIQACRIPAGGCSGISTLSRVKVRVKLKLRVRFRDQCVKGLKCYGCSIPAAE